MAEKLDSILKSYVADGTATKGKLLGASFIVVGKDGMSIQHHHRIAGPPSPLFPPLTRPPPP